MVCIYFAWAFGVTGVFGGKLEELIAFLFLVIAAAVPVIQSMRFKMSEKDNGAEPSKELEATIGFAWRSSILVGVGIAASAFSGGTELERSTIPFFSRSWPW